MGTAVIAKNILLTVIIAIKPTKKYGHLCPYFKKIAIFVIVKFFC